MTVNGNGVSWVMANERSSDTSQAVQRIPSYHGHEYTKGSRQPVRQEVIRDGKWRYLSQRDNTEFSEAREQTVAFITFTCPHFKKIIYSVAPNPNMFFPEFGCNESQLKAVLVHDLFLVFLYTTKFIQLCKKFQLHLFGSNLQFTTYSLGDSWVFYQLNRPWCQVLCRRPRGRRSNGGPRCTKIPEWSLLLQKQLVLLWGRDCETRWWAGALGEGKSRKPSSWKLRATPTPCYCPALVPFGWWEKQGLNGHPGTWEPDLFPHHTVHEFSWEWPSPQHPAGTVVNHCSTEHRALSHAFREGRVKKETTDLHLQVTGWSRAWAGGSDLPSFRPRDPSQTQHCSGSGPAQPQHQHWSTTFPVIQRKWLSLSQALLPAAPWNSLIQA